MGKPTGFMEYQRKTGNTVAPLERIKNFKEFLLCYFLNFNSDSF